MTVMVSRTTRTALGAKGVDFGLYLVFSQGGNATAASAAALWENRAPALRRSSRLSMALMASEVSNPAAWATIAMGWGV